LEEFIYAAYTDNINKQTFFPNIMYFVVSIITVTLLQLVLCQREDNKAQFMRGKEMVKYVPGGQACYRWEMYPPGSGCTGDAIWGFVNTVGDSKESGCVNHDQWSDLSYCDSGGYHTADFDSSDCSGAPTSEFFHPNGCSDFDGSYDIKESCSLDCSTGGMESVGLLTIN